MTIYDFEKLASMFPSKFLDANLSQIANCDIVYSIENIWIERTCGSFWTFVDKVDKNIDC